MATFLNAVSSVTIILLLTAVGYFCAAKGWMGPEVKAFISKYLMAVAVPIMCVYGLRSNLTREALSHSGSALLAAFLTIVVSMCLSLAVGRLLKLPRRQLGVFIMMCGVSNSLFIGYAMCSVLFGEACAFDVMLFYLVNTSFTQIVGISLVRWSGESGGFNRQMLFKFLTAPAVLSVFVAFLLVLADIQLPDMLMSFMRYVNNTVTPLALLLTGYIIYEIGLKNLRIDKSLSLVMVFRFLISPALMIALCHVFGIEGLTRSVLVVEAAMPVVTQTVVAAAEYGADAQYAARGAALTTLACFVVIPVLMVLL